PFRAPAQDGAVVSEPPLSRVPEVVERNRTGLAQSRLTLLGKPLGEIRSKARQELLDAASCYMRESGELLPDLGAGPLFMAGHQPELFHPGVWVKNFALAGLARNHHGVAVNLVVDNDTAKSTALRVPAPPSKTFAWPHLQTLPFDRWLAEKPYEELTVVD